MRYSNHIINTFSITILKNTIYLDRKPLPNSKTALAGRRDCTQFSHQGYFSLIPLLHLYLLHNWLQYVGFEECVVIEGAGGSNISILDAPATAIMPKGI